MYLVLELCTGGELFEGIQKGPYSERRAASIMRTILTSINQCHSKSILHRDVKPGNYLFLSDDASAPLKAIDFGWGLSVAHRRFPSRITSLLEFCSLLGCAERSCARGLLHYCRLAVFFKEKELPCRDLGLEGTPWYMAPETLESKARPASLASDRLRDSTFRLQPPPEQVYPASDVWAAGVCAYQLLCGRLPFDGSVLSKVGGRTGRAVSPVRACCKFVASHRRSGRPSSPKSLQ